MDNPNRQPSTPSLQSINQTAVFRTIWLFIAVGVVALVVTATPLRYQMLQADVYGYESGLKALGLSLSFFAAYFVFWELIVVIGSLAVATFIMWKRSQDWFAMLVAMTLALIGLLPPLIDGISFKYPQWTIPIALLRLALLSSLMAVFCLFPNGRFTPKWMRWLLLAQLVFSLLVAIFKPTALADTAVLPTTSTLDDSLWLIIGGGWFIAVLVGQGVRYRNYSTPVEKQQSKWVLFGLMIVIIFSVISPLLLVIFPQLNEAPENRALFTLVVGVLFLLSTLTLPTAFALAMLRYQLWQVDIFINRTLVYGGLSLGIVAVYVLVVGTLGTLFRLQGNFLFALLATGLIAVLFQPVRERLQRGVNRLMFGERDDPYAVLSKLGTQLQTTATPEAMLQSVVETIAATIKLPYVAIELADKEGRLRGTATGTAVAQTAEFPLRYQNETVGYLVVSPRSPGESFTERERQLLADIAGQTGAVAYSVRLTAALQRSAAALQQSREKLVLTREEERRRIRRDLHDELGPTLASQTFALDAALDALERDPQTAAKLLQALKTQNQATVADIRRLVYELRPPTLDELGIMGALQAYVARLDGGSLPYISITANPDPLPPLSAAVEVAAYRIAVEAMTNVVRHAQARRCDVCLCVQGNGRSHLRIEVSDDGVGLSPDRQPGVGLSSMRERAEELGGSLAVMNEEAGVRVTARLPL